MVTVLICLGVYLGVCPLALLVFLLGNCPRLSDKNWFWPVVFLWPVLLVWPIYGGAKWVSKRNVRQGCPGGKVLSEAGVNSAEKTTI